MSDDEPQGGAERRLGRGAGFRYGDIPLPDLTQEQLANCVAVGLRAGLRAVDEELARGPRRGPGRGVGAEADRRMPIFPGPPEIRAAVIAALGIEKTGSYLDACGWDAATREVRPATDVARSHLLKIQSVIEGAGGRLGVKAERPSGAVASGAR